MPRASAWAWKNRESGLTREDCHAPTAEIGRGFVYHGPADGPGSGDGIIPRGVERQAMPIKYVIVIPDGAADEPQDVARREDAPPGGAHPGDGPDRPRGGPGTIEERARPVPPGQRRRDPEPLRLRPRALLHRPCPARGRRDGAFARARRLGGPVQPDDDPRRADDRLHRRPHHERGRTPAHRGAPGRGRASRRRVPPGGQLPQPHDRAGRARRSALRRRHEDHAAARRPRPARGRPPAPRGRAAICSAS